MEIVWTAPEYALVISTLTSLLALGLPPILSAFDARRARRKARKEEMERLLFFVVGNCRRQRFQIDKLMQAAAKAVRRGEERPTTPTTLEDVSIEGFQLAIPQLKALAALHRINDAGFFAALEAYLDILDAAPIALSNTDSTSEEAHIRELLDLYKKRSNLETQIETATAAFLTHIETRFG